MIQPNMFFDSLEIKGVFFSIGFSVDFGLTFLCENFGKEIIMKIYEKIWFFGMVLFAEPLLVGLMRLEGWPHGGDYPKTMDSMCAENALAKSAHGCSTRPPSTISFSPYLHDWEVFMFYHMLFLDRMALLRRGHVISR